MRHKMTRIPQRPQATAHAVLSIIKRQGHAAANDLAAALSITGMAVRKHLTALCASGLVTFDTQRRPRGRPVRLYRLTEAGHDVFPKDYENLALTVLERVAEKEGPERIAALVQAYQDDLRARAAERLKGLGLEERVAQLTALLDEQGHMAHWQPHPEGYLITEHNCTIARVSRRFPECCRLELELFSDLLGAPVERLTDQAAGDLLCSYLVRKPEA